MAVVGWWVVLVLVVVGWWKTIHWMGVDKVVPGCCRESMRMPRFDYWFVGLNKWWAGERVRVVGVVVCIEEWQV